MVVKVVVESGQRAGNLGNGNGGLLGTAQRAVIIIFYNSIVINPKGDSYAFLVDCIRQ
jgi:hypothetical protein